MEKTYRKARSTDQAPPGRGRNQCPLEGHKPREQKLCWEADWNQNQVLRRMIAPREMGKS